MKKILRATPLHLSKTGELDGLAYLMINLPFVCNYRCKKCFNSSGFAGSKGKPIGTEKILQLVSEFGNLGGKVIALAGEGEPTLNCDIKKVVEKINDAGMIPIVYSNGSMLNQKIIEFYASRNVTLVISFDSLERDLYIKLTQCESQAVFDRVMENIKTIREVYGKLIRKERGYKLTRVALNMTVHSLNKNEVVKIKKFCGDDVYFICNPLAKLGNGDKNWHKLVKNDDDYEKIRKLVARMSETSGPLTLGTNGLCGYSINGIAISPSGDYMTCAYTSLTDGLLGSVKTKSLQEAYLYKSKNELSFYKKYGACPCLVRSEKFDLYLKTLKLNED